MRGWGKMKLLLDTNIFLEIILDQEKAAEAKNLLLQREQHDFFISDYSLHSIGLLLFRKNRHSVFQKFIQDVILNAGIGVLSVTPGEMKNVISAAQKFGLDFDDAYQYTVATSARIEIVSFDNDFTRTDFGRKTPAEIL